MSTESEATHFPIERLGAALAGPTLVEVFVIAARRSFDAGLSDA